LGEPDIQAEVERPDQGPDAGFFSGERRGSVRVGGSGGVGTESICRGVWASLPTSGAPALESMKPYRLNRRLHAQIGFWIAAPLLLVTVTGILLLVKKQWGFVQPPEQRGTVAANPAGLDVLLASLTAEPELGVVGWESVDRLDVRPGKGLVKAQLADGREVQLDLATGRILQIAVRRTDLIEALHDGSYFGGEGAKLGFFLPVACAFVLLIGSGLWMWWYPIQVRRRVARDQGRSEQRAPST
jgi:uncharacterized iron-regulated membrane protein